MQHKTTMHKIGKNQYRVNYWSDRYQMYTDMDSVFTLLQAVAICHKDNAK